MYATIEIIQERSQEHAPDPKATVLQPRFYGTNTRFDLNLT